MKHLSDKSGFNVLKSEKKDTVKISDITMLKSRKSLLIKYFIKHNTDFHINEIKKPQSSSSRKISDPQSSVVTEVKPLYSAKQNIKADKKEWPAKTVE